MADFKYDATLDAVRELLRGGGEFNEADRLIADLTSGQATTCLKGAPYSIATLVAHILWNIQNNLADAGVGEPSSLNVVHIGDSFPEIAAGEWPELRQTFLDTLERVDQVLPELAGRPSTVNEETGVLYDFAEMALHNAYHLGQIVLLRRMAGLWPPKDGDTNDW